MSNNLTPGTWYYSKRLDREVLFVEYAKWESKYPGHVYVEWRDERDIPCGWYLLPEDLQEIAG